MSDEDDLTRILVEDMDEEILSKMPDWLKILRHAFEKQQVTNVEGHADKQCQERSC